jgi:hypothetical protein
VSNNDMASQKMVDGDLLSKLLEGSYETMISRVDDAVLAHADLFGGADGVEVRALGTYPNHVIVANSEGGFYRAAYTVTEDTSTVSFGEVERVQIPVKEASELSVEARESAAQAVEAIMSGDDEAATKAVANLYGMVQAGVRLTAESVEDATKSLFADGTDWGLAIRDNEKSIRGFVGADADRDLPKPKFEHIESLDGDEDRARKIVGGALRRLRESLATMHTSLALAREINENYVLKADGPDVGLAAEDFVAFVESFNSDLAAMKGMAEDAVAVSTDGDVKSLARIHDTMAARMYETGLAAAFCEKFARRFDAPKAA